jgi:hypothetical protein
MGIQEVRWDISGTEPADHYMLFYGKRNADHHLGTGFFIYKGIVSDKEGRFY